MSEENVWLETIGPIAGTIGAAALITVATEKLAVPRKYLGLGAAGVGVVTALNTKGWIRQTAISVAATGAGLAILDWIGFFTSPALPPRNAAVDESTAAGAAAVGEAAEESTQPVPKSFGEESPPSEQPSRVANDLPPGEQNQPKALPGTFKPTPEVVTKLQEVHAGLTDDENSRLRQIAMMVPPAMLAEVNGRLASTPAQEAIRYIREKMLPNFPHVRAASP